MWVRTHHQITRFIINKTEGSSLIYTPDIHWVVRGTGTPKDKDEVNRREVCDCDG